MKPYDRAELIAEILRSRAPVVLFGAGDLGKLAHCVLATHGVPVTAFVDGRQAKHGQWYRDVEILATGQLPSLPRDAVVFVCNNYLMTVPAQLDAAGFTNVHDAVALLENFDFSATDIDMDPVSIERKVALHKRECLKARDKDADVLVLKYLDVVVTEACSMKCQDCSNLMQYYTKPRNSDLDLLESAVDRIMASIDHIYEFRVLGGEPFVNRHVNRVINKLTGYGEVDKVVIFTNATIVPFGENLTCLQNDKVVVYITNYGEHSKSYDKLLEVLEANGIAHLTKIPEWTDSGRIKLVERSAEVLDDMFMNCCVNDVLTLLNGHLYRCPFSANGTNLHAIPYNEADVVDLTGDLHGAELRAAIERLYAKKTHLTACRYCNGRDFRTPRIEPAIQVRRPLPLIF
jgi:hypothetical protein